MTDHQRRNRPRRRKRRSKKPEALLSDLFDVDPADQDEEDNIPKMPRESAVTAVSARTIKTHLDTFVVGQERAKRALSVLFSLHVGSAARARTDDPGDESSYSLARPPNALLIGPTGVGKTHTITVAADYLRLPVVIVDATSLVPAGAPAGSGRQLEDIVDELLAVAHEMDLDWEEDLAGHGVIFLDEFDKITSERPEAGGVAQYAHWYRTVQRRLLKFIEGSLVEGSRAIDGVNTSNILFVASGAFAGIESPEIIAKRPPTLSLQDIAAKAILSADIVAYGFIPELVARLPVIVQFDSLSRKDLLEIMSSQVVDPMRTWKEHFASVGKDVHLTQAANELIVGRAFDLGMGARGVSQVLYAVMFPIAYDLEHSEGSHYEVDADVVRTLLRGI